MCALTNERQSTFENGMRYERDTNADLKRRVKACAVKDEAFSCVYVIVVGIDFREMVSNKQVVKFEIAF